MADVYVTCSVSPCVIQHTVDIPPLNIDEAGGGLLAGAIVGVWALGFAFRSFIRMLRIDSADSGSDGSDS